MSLQTSERTSNTRFLITGAKGCIGAWVVKNLVERGDQPWVFDVDAESHRLRALLSEEQMSRIGFIQGDVTQFEDLDRAVADHGITHIIHLAALQVPACAANPLLGARVNILGTLNVFEIARRRRDLVKGIVYASSAAVFGPDEFYSSTTVQEGASLWPGTHYGVFKQCNEGNARVFFASDGISSVGLRPWAVYGVGRDQGITSGPTKAIKACVVGRPYTIKFTGWLDLQYVNDTAEIFIRCAESEVSGAKVYTMRGAVTRIEDFIATLRNLVPGKAEAIRAEGKALPIAHDLDDSLLVHDLQGVPRTSLETGVRETVEIFEHLKREGRLDTKDLDS